MASLTLSNYDIHSPGIVNHGLESATAPSTVIFLQSKGLRFICKAHLDRIDHPAEGERKAAQALGSDGQSQLICFCPPVWPIK